MLPLILHSCSSSGFDLLSMQPGRDPLLIFQGCNLQAHVLPHSRSLLIDDKQWQFPWYYLCGCSFAVSFQVEDGFWAGCSIFEVLYAFCWSCRWCLPKRTRKSVGSTLISSSICFCSLWLRKEIRGRREKLEIMHFMIELIQLPTKFWLWGDFLHIQCFYSTWFYLEVCMTM